MGYKHTSMVDWVPLLMQTHGKQLNRRIRYYPFISSLFWLGFFWLLFSSLLLLVETQHFSCCILQPSPGIPCFSGYSDDSAWKIILKVFMLIKQGVQEIWRCYSNNGVVVFHAYQSEKHHKNILETHHEMNLKCKIQWPQLILMFLCSDKQRTP